MVAADDTLSKISRIYGKPVADLARANNIDANASLNVGDRIIFPVCAAQLVIRLRV
jgi:LysM repeat protein